MLDFEAAGDDRLNGELGFGGLVKIGDETMVGGGTGRGAGEGAEKSAKSSEAKRS